MLEQFIRPALRAPGPLKRYVGGYLTDLEAWKTALYRPVGQALVAREACRPVRLVAIPYYVWGNRGILYRASVEDPALAEMIHFEPGTLRGGQVGATYSYTDTVPSEGIWWYWLAEVNTSGRETIRASTNGNVGVNATLSNRIFLPIVVKSP